MIERVEPLTDFRFELAGILCTAEYEVIEGSSFASEWILSPKAADRWGDLTSPRMVGPVCILSLKKTTSRKSSSIAMQSRGVHKEPTT
jgi:hypothetical protein